MQRTDTGGPGESSRSSPWTGPAGPTDPDVALARELAREAGERLLELRAGWAEGADGLRAAGDRLGHEVLMAGLGRWRPQDAVLSEEGRDDHTRHGAERVWIVDPLDGTREFAEPGRTDWAVHVALWCRDDDGSSAGGGGDGGGDSSGGGHGGGRLAAGAVALPAQGRVLSCEAGGRLPDRAPGPVRIVVSRSRPPELVTAVAEQLGAELVPMGSAGAKVAAVVLGSADAYVHGGGQYEWDSAAPVAVARAVGAHASRLDGSALRYNAADPLLPDLVVARPEYAERLLAAIAGVSGAAEPDRRPDLP